MCRLILEKNKRKRCSFICRFYYYCKSTILKEEGIKREKPFVLFVDYLPLTNIQTKQNKKSCHTSYLNPPPPPRTRSWWWIRLEKEQSERSNKNKQSDFFSSSSNFHFANRFNGIFFIFKVYILIEKFFFEKSVLNLFRK